MNLALSERKLFTQRSLGEIAASLLLFLYFFTSGADKLHFHLFVFKGKANNFFALLLVIGFCAIYRRIYMRASLLIPAAHLFLALIVSSFFSPYPSRSFGYVAVYAIEFIFYFLLSYNLIIQCNEHKILSIYWKAFWFVGLHGFLQLFLSIFGIMDPFVGQWIGKLARPHSFFYEPSYYALFMSIIVMYLNAKILFDDDPRLLRRPLIPLFFINFLFLLSTSTGAFLGYFFLIPALFFMKFFVLKKEIAPFFYRKSALIIASFVSLLSIAFLLLPNIFYTFFFKFFNANFFAHGSFATRWDGVVRAWEVFMQYPIFGRGIGGIGAHFYYINERITEGTPLSLLELEQYDPMNIFTEILGSLGLFGALAIGTCLYFFVKDIKKLTQLYRSYKKETIIAFSLLISWLITLCVYQFSPGMFRNYIWIHFGIVLGYIHKLFLKAGVTSELPWRLKR